MLGEPQSSWTSFFYLHEKLNVSIFNQAYKI